jgi:hypothetical protein
MPSAGDLRGTAARLHAEAAWLSGALDSIGLTAGPAVWRGPASSRFDAELQDERRRLGAVADDLRLLARTFSVAAEKAEAAEVARALSGADITLLAPIALPAP